MSIFEYDDFQAWEGFSELNMAMLRLRGTLGDKDAVRAMFETVPSDLKDQSLAYALEYSVTALSGKQLELATELGALNLITPQNSLEVALRIRDCLFTRTVKESGHVKLLAELAGQHGEAFAVDTMHAAFNPDNVKRKLNLKSFANLQQRADTFVENLGLVERFIDEKWRKSIAVGNVAFRSLSVQETSGAPRGDFTSCLNLVSEYETNDLSAVMNVVKEDIGPRSKLLARQIDSSLRHNFNSMLHTHQEGAIFDALKSRPVSGLSSLITMSETDLCSMISGTGMARYAQGEWLNKHNVDQLADRNFMDLVALFNDRLTSNPYFAAAASQEGGINNPSKPGIPFLLLAPTLIKQGIAVSLKPEFSGGRSAALDSMAEAIGLVGKIDGMQEYVDAGVTLMSRTMEHKLVHAYKVFSSDKEFGKDILQPKSALVPDGVDRDYQARFAAIRLCAEVHQQADKKTATWEKKHTPFQYFSGDIDSLIKSKKALLTLVKTYDEDTILEALKSYKAGLMPLIEAGVVDRKHMNKLTLKERGQILEQDLGM